jgi:hypothetical protein
MRAPLASALAIGVGLIVLTGYFIPFGPLQDARGLVLNWGVTLAGVAALVGVFNLFGVHWRKLVGARREKDFYSLFFILAFVATLGVGLYLTPSDPGFQKFATRLQAPVETSLMAMLSVTLSYASLRLLQRRRDFMSVLFVISVVFFLIFESGLLSFLGGAVTSGDLFHFIKQIPVAGGRGILLGVALGTLTAGLRIMIGADRPYSG